MTTQPLGQSRNRRLNFDIDPRFDFVVIGKAGATIKSLVSGLCENATVRNGHVDLTGRDIFKLQQARRRIEVMVMLYQAETFAIEDNNFEQLLHDAHRARCFARREGSNLILVGKPVDIKTFRDSHSHLEGPKSDEEVDSLISAMETMSEFSAHPDVYADVLIVDINDTDLASVDALIAPHSDPSSTTFSGIIFGIACRVFVQLPVFLRFPTNIAWVTFLVDTGSPSTFLRSDVFEKFFTDAVPSACNFSICGVGITVQISGAHFSNVNLLGSDFLNSGRVLLTIDYKMQTSNVEVR